jgi:hypothetical protein
MLHLNARAGDLRVKIIETFSRHSLICGALSAEVVGRDVFPL